MKIPVHYVLSQFICKYLKGYILLALFILFCLPTLCTGQGNLLVNPKRVLFEGSKRSEEINLANIGKDTATFIISFNQIRMNEDGSFENILQPDSGQQFADKNLRIFPRTVTLSPNESQVVKLQLIKSNELAPGEYRSHLYFRALPDNKPLGDSSKIKNDTAVAVKITPIFGITIPAIIRVGENNTSVNMSDVSFGIYQDTIPMMDVTFNRNGAMSVYGDIAVDHISNYGKVTRVATAKGVAVYTPTAKRKMKIKLNGNAGADLGGGRLRVKYTDQSFKQNILAQQEIDIKS